ncbi:acyl-CoA dehydrogenase [Pseudonocardia sulfidoxydans NBRC 16205]|uniref:Acyl-CoA dehydrogenase n=1 Tax=Pseudonocardia sulfidoxydans NBRC 16205 TaxID=1223511 RepID=A0A511DKC9_9PSEU|nr:acyl-CoA dehydrogenase family protein [Pseudonocardia sulfidoxydans]GEL24244.1 acyl-CoA dehydrogenase [Pseudonocardia sulfidoxydans NBRC 16205]
MTLTEDVAQDRHPVETPEEFGARLRRWLRSATENLAPSATTFADRAATHAAMYDAGLFGMTWPIELGGRSLPTTYQTVFNREVAGFEWAIPDSSVTVGICAPTMADHGTPEQQARHISRMLRGDEVWTQLLSEPGAGSDLAAVSVRAIRDGDDFVLDGQKIWTSDAVEADYALALVRTDPGRPRHGGLSMLIVPLSEPGVDIRPLRDMTGDAPFNEVFLNEARVPVANLVGRENEGWTVLTTMLRHERIALSAGTAGARMDVDAFGALVALARARGVLDRTDVRDTLAEVFVQQRILDITGRRMREGLESGELQGPAGSLGKMGTAMAARAVAEATLKIEGMEGVAWRPDDGQVARRMREVLQFPKPGIAGGTTEIQKNVVAERLLGMPRDR